MSLNSDTFETEKRRYVRQKCEADVEWAYFNSANYFHAKLLNFSRGGVYIETVNDITPGATIVIRLGKVLSSKIESTDDEYPRLVSLGEVAWQTAFSDGNRSYFRAGIRYPITA